MISLYFSFRTQYKHVFINTNTHTQTYACTRAYALNAKGRNPYWAPVIGYKYGGGFPMNGRMIENYSTIQGGSVPS